MSYVRDVPDMTARLRRGRNARSTSSYRVIILFYHPARQSVNLD
jgi:hypothetical protein